MLSVEKLSLVAVLVFVLQLCNAQPFSIKGYVKTEAGEPIANASVLVGYAQKNYICDEQGFFQVQAPSGATPMVIKALGFSTLRFGFTVEKDTTLIINLIEFENQLEQVVVSSDRSDNNIGRPVGIAQLNTKALKLIPAAFGETDLLRGLQMLPGVSTVGEASNGINVRGGTTDQNLMLLDETPIFNPTHLFGLFSIFPPDAVSRAELYKGNVPSRFGGRASSVLDVTLANPTLDSFRMEGGIGIVSSRILADLPIIPERLGVLVSGRVSFTDFLLPVISKENFEQTRANFQETSLKAVFRADQKNSFFLSCYYSNDFFQTDLLGTIANINNLNTQNAYSTLNLNLRHFVTLGKKMSISSAASYVDYQPELRLPEKAIDNTVLFQSGIFFRQIRSNLDYFDDRHQAKIGISSAWYKINPGELIPNKSLSVNPLKTNVEYGLESALFAEDNFKITPKVAASVGLRYSLFMALGPGEVRSYLPNMPFSEFTVLGSESYNNWEVIKTYGGLEPRLGLRYDLSSSASLKLAYNLMRQYLQAVTNTTTPLPTSRWKTSDAYIKPQVSQAFSVGWFQDLSKEKIYEVSAELYYRLTKNVLDYKQGANLLLQQFPETELLTGNNYSYGLEMMASKKKGDWTGWLTYTFSRSKNEVAGINDGNLFAANYDRPHTVNAFLNFKNNENHNFSFTFTYSTGRPFSSPNGTFNFQGINYPFYPARNNDRLPDYHRLDFSWNILTTLNSESRWKNYWTFSVYNLYGRGNPYSIFFNNSEGPLKSYALKVFAAPIVSLAYNIKFRS